MRRISTTLVAVAMLGALLSPGIAQSVAVPAGTSCALVLTPLDTAAGGYYCSTTFSSYENLRYDIVGDAAWEVDILNEQGRESLLSRSGYGSQSDTLTINSCGLPCRIRLHITPFNGPVVGMVSLSPVYLGVGDVPLSVS